MRSDLCNLLTSSLLGESFSDLTNRRSFLKSIGTTVIGASSLSFNQYNQSNKTDESRFDTSNPKIAIIGAGIAGLTASYYLKKHGYLSTVYESNRVGGRILTYNGTITKNIYTEAGGEFIDSNHRAVLGLCKEFNLPLLDLGATTEAALIKPDYYFKGGRITNVNIINELKKYSFSISKDIKDINGDFSSKNKTALRLDRMSIDEYLSSKDISGWLFDLLSVSFTSELGVSAAEQSALNMLLMINPQPREGKFEIYGDSDERYKVATGNFTIIDALQKKIESQIKESYKLVKLSSSGKQYCLSFDNGKEVKADVVIITIPFSVLREVELNIEMPAIKKQCINDLGYGQHSKLYLGFNEQYWRKSGYSGYLLSENLHNGWDSSQLQNKNSGKGIYTLLLGSDKGLRLSISQYDYYLKEMDLVYPGAENLHNGDRAFTNWNQNPASKGSYACYLIGQVTAFNSVESTPVGHIYFAGEHCSQSFQGYMEGSVRTALNVVKKITKSSFKI